MDASGSCGSLCLRAGVTPCVGRQGAGATACPAALALLLTAHPPAQIVLDRDDEDAQGGERRRDVAIRSQNLVAMLSASKALARAVLPTTPFPPTAGSGAWWHEMRCDPVRDLPRGDEGGDASCYAVFDDAPAKMAALRRAADAVSLLVQTRCTIRNAR